MTIERPLSTASLPRPDPARGAFETLLVVDGRPVELDAHLARLAASARALFGAPAMARVAGPARALAESSAAELSHAGRLRLTLAPDEQGRLDLSARSAPVDPEAVFPGPERAPTLAPIVVPGGLGAHKWADRRLLDAAAAQLDGALPLILDVGETVLEAERANLFLVRDETLLTPPADGRLLPGVTRARVMEVAAEIGIAVVEQPIAFADIPHADEAFLTGSVRGVEPIATRAAPGGAVTVRVAAALRELWLGGA